MKESERKTFTEPTQFKTKKGIIIQKYKYMIFTNITVHVTTFYKTQESTKFNIINEGTTDQPLSNSTNNNNTYRDFNMMIVLKYFLQQKSWYYQNCHSLEYMCYYTMNVKIIFKYGDTPSLFFHLDLGDKKALC